MPESTPSEPIEPPSTCETCDSIGSNPMPICQISGVGLCENCAHTCENCSQFVALEESVCLTDDNSRACVECASTCSDCNSIVLLDTTFMNANEESVCEECFHTHYHSCEACDNAYRTSDLNSDGRRIICDGCFQDYFTCSTCDRIHHMDDYNLDNQCNDCYEEENDQDGYGDEDYDICLQTYSANPRVVCYSSKANWKFHKLEHENTNYLGMELELGLPNCNQIGAVRIVNQFFPEKFIAKDDASCDVELVFTPMTLEFYKTQPLKEMLRALSQGGCNSYKHGNCGLHVHATKPTHNQIEQLRWFFSANRKTIIKFSQRTIEKCDEWCRIPTLENLHSWGRGRHEALNPTEHTLEFRIFRGTLSFPRLWASLEFVDAMLNFAPQIEPLGLLLTYEGAGWPEFIEFIRNDSKYSHLYNYLKKKELV